MTTTTQDTITPATASDAPAAKQTLFKVGWSYDVFLRKNGLPPSAAANEEWLALSRQASKAQVDEMHTMSLAGAKTVCKQSAVFSTKDGRYNTVLTAKVVKPGCADIELIENALLRAQKSASKRLSAMRMAAAHQGVIV